VKIYRSLTKIKAISFDLDDTLYSNRPVMVATEKAMVPYFNELLSSYSQTKGIQFNKDFWRPFRIDAYRQSPLFKNDVSQLRLATYTAGIQSLDIPQAEAIRFAKQAMAYFLEKRSDFSVPSSSLALLMHLKTKYPLVAISNGNVDTKAIGLDGYFDHIYHAGNGMAKKPAGDLFDLASQDLAISSQHILHVGDCGFADILGAHRAGMQTAWLSCYNVGKPISVLPHIELQNVAELAAFI